MKRILVLVVAIGLAMSLAMQRPSQAQTFTAQSSPFSQSFTLTAAGQRTPTINFSEGTSSCSVVVVNGASFTLVPQAASDGINGNTNPSWVTATTIGSGSITSVGTYTGSIAGIGLTSFGAILTTFTSGTISGTITCSGAVAVTTPLPSGQGGFSNLVCTGNVVCSPSAGPTPAVAITNAPTFTGQVAAGGFGASPSGAWNGSCTGSTSASTCTATIGTTFAAPLCFSNDTNQTPNASIRTVCSVSGTTVTVQTLQQLLTGSCSMVSATTCTSAASYRLAASTCWAQSTTAQILEAAICSLATTTVTITANASNSLTWNYFVFGAPEVAHTYQFVVFGAPN